MPSLRIKNYERVPRRKLVSVSPEIDHPHPLVNDMWYDAQLARWDAWWRWVTLDLPACAHAHLPSPCFPVKRSANHTENKQPQTTHSVHTEYVPGKVAGDLDGISSPIPQLSACLTHAYGVHDREHCKNRQTVNPSRRDAKFCNWIYEIRLQFYLFLSVFKNWIMAYYSASMSLYASPTHIGPQLWRIDGDLRVAETPCILPIFFRSRLYFYS